MIRQIRSCTLVIPSKTIPDSRPKSANSTPVFRPKRHKNPTLWGSTYLHGSLREYPPGIWHKFSFGSIHKFHSVSGLLFPQQKPVSFPFIYLFSDPKGSCCFFFHFEITGLDFTSTGQNNSESKKLREKSLGAPFWANRAHTVGS